MRKYAKAAVQSANTEHAQQKQRSRGSTISYSASTAILSPKKPSTISSSKEDGQCKKKTRRKNEKEQKKTLNRTECPIKIQILQRLRTKTKIGKILAAEKKTIDKKIYK